MMAYYIKKIFVFFSLLVGDLIGLLGLLYFSFYIRNYIVLHDYLNNKQVVPFSSFYNVYLPILGFTIFFFIYNSLYLSRNNLYVDYKKILKSVFLLVAFLSLITFALKLEHLYSRLIVGLFIFFILTIYPFYKWLLKIFLFKIGIWKKKVIVVGKNLPLFLRKIIFDRYLGYVPIFVNISKFEDLSSVLTDYVDSFNSLDLIIVGQDLNMRELKGFLRDLEFKFETIKIYNALSDFFRNVYYVKSNFPFNFLVVKNNLVKPYNRLVKEALDLSLSLLFLLMTSPLFMVISFILFVFNKGEIFFIQERVGVGGGTFKLIKFRTMYENGDSLLKEFFEKNKEAEEEWKKYKKIKGKDPRVTPFGKFLRRFSLDELPQLINVLKGDMSLVGPRPYLKDEIRKVSSYRKSVMFYTKPGITGLWQAMGRNDLDFEHRLLLDEFYVRNWSLDLDFYIILRTLITVFKGY